MRKDTKKVTRKIMKKRRMQKVDGKKKKHRRNRSGTYFVSFSFVRDKFIFLLAQWEEEEAYSGEQTAWEEEESAYPQAQAIGDWAAANEGDLGLTTGEIVWVQDNQSDPTGWWTIARTDGSGQSGYAPSTYLQML